MFAALLRRTSSIRYSPLGQSHQQFLRFVSSKRLPILVAAVLIVLLLFTTSRLRGRHLRGSKNLSFDPLPHNVADAVDWSRFAYTQYATNAPYLCNSVMLFERLHKLGSRAERLLMYPSKIEENGTDSESRLLRKARDEYNVKLKPIEVIQRDSQDGNGAMLATGPGTWGESYTKLLAFNQTQYARVLQLDSDSTLLKVCLWTIKNLDDLADLDELDE
ncbi:MAG: hypothetical protein Q9198_006121 [Flavoplaca austrocitrina]